MNLVKCYFSRKLALWLVLLAAALAPLATVVPGVGQTIPGPVADRYYLPLIFRPLPPTATPVPTNTRVPTATPTPTNTPLPAATSTPLPTPTTALLYICDHDAYNCSDFNTQAQAQRVFNYCAERGFGDIHRLDQNNDGEACESLPLEFP